MVMKFEDAKPISANGNNVVNENHLQGVDKGGSLTACDITLGFQGETEGQYIIIGGMNQMNLSVQNQIIPLAELGSKKWNMLYGKTMPGNMSAARYFINTANLLKILSSGMDSSKFLPGDKDNERLVLDLAKDFFSKAMDYYLIMQWKKSIKGVPTIVRTEVKKIRGTQITSYGMSFGSGIVVMENMQFMFSGIEDYYSEGSDLE